MKSYLNGNYSFYFRDFNKLKEKISSMKADGVDQLQIVSDFDQTTTCFQINNNKVIRYLGLLDYQN